MQNKVFNKASYIIIFFLSYFSFVVFYLSYDIVQSPDFEKYYRYILQFDGKIINSNLEQGVLYFYLNYLTSLVVKFSNPILTTNEILNLSIHSANSIFVFIGILGIFKYLQIKKFKSRNIILSIFVLITLPIFVQLRLTFKPEIFAFSLFSWVLYFLESYKLHNKKINLFKFAFFLAIILTLKISISLLIGIYIFIELITNYKEIFSWQYFKLFLFFFLILLVNLSVNFLVNDKYLYEVNHDEKYNNKADLTFFSTFDYTNLIDNPNRTFFTNSFFGITLLDTFGDFFMLYWESEYTELNSGRYDFFEIYDNDNFNTIPKINYDKKNNIIKIAANFDERFNVEDYVDESRIRAGYKMTIIFYFLLLASLLFLKNVSKILLSSPIIGIFIIALSAAGIFKNNFDPLIADSVKVFYYGFFVVFSFIYLLNLIINKLKIGKIFIVCLLILINLFILGFPHSYNSTIEDDINYKNSLLIGCELNKPITNFMFNIRGNTCVTENFEYIQDSKVKSFIPITIVEDLNFKFQFSFLTLINVFLIFFLIVTFLLLKFDKLRLMYE